MKTIKRKPNLNPHQIDILKKYYPIDEENKIVTIKIYYDKATDMLDFSVGEMHQEIMSNEVLEKISNITDTIPYDYKAEVIFIINDYCDYNPNDLMYKLNDLIEINNFQIIRQRKKNMLVASILLIIGFLILFVLGWEKSGTLGSWFGTGIKQSVFEEMFDITSWVFIWQAVTVLFLTPSALVKVGVKFLSRINKITFEDEKGKALTSETRQDIIENWDVDSKFRALSRASLLIFSTLLIGIGVYSFSNNLFEFIESIKMVDSNAIVLELIIIIPLLLLSDSFSLACGILGLFAFRGNLKARKVHFPILCVHVSLLLISTILSFVINDSTTLETISKIFLVTLELFFLTTVIVTKAKAKKHNA